MHKEAFEPTGLIPRSIIRTFDRFRQQLLPGTEQIAIQEYRISRYQILVSIKALCTLIFVPFLVTYTVKFFLITPITEHFWDYQQGDIFLNSYQEKRAFNEMHDFSEKIFFESLVNSNGENDLDRDQSSQFQPRATFGLGSTSDVSIELPSRYNQTDLQRSSPDTARTKPSVLLEASSLGCSASLSKPKANLSSALAHKDVAERECSGPLRGPEQALAQQLVISGPYGPDAGTLDFSASKDGTLGRPELRSGWPLRGLKDRPLFTNQDEGRAGLGWPERPRTTLNLQIRFQKKSLEIVETYNRQSILAITCLLGDFVTLLTLYILFVLPQMKPQVIILKSFLTESLYSLSDTTKSFLLILGMDLLVGFHSPRGWEIVLESALRHFGLPENESFILLFVALFPVFLDTVFKYWIFRYLNKISPSTVVTYHSMLE